MEMSQAWILDNGYVTSRKKKIDRHFGYKITYLGGCVDGLLGVVGVHVGDGADDLAVDGVDHVKGVAGGGRHPLAVDETSVLQQGRHGSGENEVAERDQRWRLGMNISIDAEVS